MRFGGWLLMNTENTEWGMAYRLKVAFAICKEIDWILEGSDGLRPMKVSGAIGVI